MALSRAERVSLVDAVLADMGGRRGGEAWSIGRINTVLSVFELSETTTVFAADALEHARRQILRLDDPSLMEIAQMSGADIGSIERSASATDAYDDLWLDDHIRVFLSHSGEHKDFVAQVAARMQVAGAHAFVAHAAIHPTREWQGEIERALRSADAFVGLVHPKFVVSPWVNQEIGWALGRGLPCYFVSFGVQPQGFPARLQWRSLDGLPADRVAQEIAEWINTVPAFSERVGGGLVSALRDAGDFVSTGAIAERLNALGSLTPRQFEQLDEVFVENDQVHGGILARRALAPLYQRAGREFPGIRDVH